jgi:hypothetical protein
MPERGHPNILRPAAEDIQPSEDQRGPSPRRLLTRREERRLQEASRLDVDQAVLDRLTGVELIVRALTDAIGVQRAPVLWSGTAILDTNGRWTKNFGAESLAISVTNYTGNGQLTVQAGEPGPTAPGPGVGVHNVPAGVSQVFNNKTTAWSLYGTAGNVIDIQVFGRVVTPIAAGDI